MLLTLFRSILDENGLLSAAYALEKKSEHPLAGAINRKAQEQGLVAASVEQFQALPGNGLTGVCNGEVLLGGSFKYISGHINIPDDIKKESEKLSKEGKTPLFLQKTDSLAVLLLLQILLKRTARKP